jgi:hypothetical protein
VEFNDRQILALDVAAGLTASSVQRRLDRGADVTKAIRPGMQLYKAAETWQVPSDARIARIQVIAGPQNMLFLGTSGPAMRLEDLEWILHSAQESPIDLWYFVHDLENPVGIGGSFAWDMIDRWEVWRERKGFYLGGSPLSFLSFSPHAAVAEWEDAALASPVERALHVLELPSVDAWPIAAIDDRAGHEIGNISTDEIFQLVVADVPVAIAKADPAAPPEHLSTLWSVATGVVWKLEQIGDVFVKAAQQSHIRSLRVLFQFEDRDAGPTLTLVSYDEGTLTIGWDDRLESALAHDSGAVETSLVGIIAQVFDESVRDDLVLAWQTAPPGIRMDGYSVVQTAKELPEPLDDHEATRSRTVRELGEHLAAESVSPGIFEGAEATAFESRTVFPWLVARMHEYLGDLNPDSLLPFALAQLERLHHQRHIEDLRFRWRKGFPSYVEGDDSDHREPNARAARAVSLMVEEILAHPPTGQTGVDDLAWTEALAVAQLCIESCFRSDAIHQRLRPTTVEVTDYYEVRIHENDSATDIDLTAYSRHRARTTLPDGLPITTGQTEAPDEEQPQSVVESRPRLASIDAALRADLGFGLDAIVGVLNVARQWDADRSTSATLTSSEALVAQCTDLVLGATPSECAKAVQWLTLRATDLGAETIPHWETERRAKRVLTSPLVAADGGLWVLPWLAGSTLRIFANYLTDGRLPWPDSTLPERVVEALDQYRQTNNRDLEKEIVKALDATPLVVRGGVKPEKAAHYGFTRLSGEIDALCFDPARSRVWVIEAKDPYTPYSYRQIRRLFDDFHKPKKKYIDKLLQKVDDISSSASQIAAKLGVPNPTRSWVTHGLMVTRHVEPAAFSVNPRVLFCVLEDVVDVVGQDNEPGIGFYERN